MAGQNSKVAETKPSLVPTSRANAEHYVWGEGCDAWHLVRDPGLSVIEERMPPGTSELRHYHRQARQLFYVLSGEAIMDVEGKEVQLTAGQGIWILPGIPHQIHNESREPVSFLVISQPPSHGDRIEE